MKSPNLKILSLLSALLFAGAACGGGSDTKSEPESKTFESSAGRFSAEFPGEPDEQTQNTTAEGINLELHFFTAETDDYAVSVGYVDYPADFATVDPKVILGGVAPGAAGNVAGGRVTKNEPGTFLDVDSVDYQVSSDDVELQAKAFLIENRMYLLQAVSADLADADAQYDKLVESFKLL